MAEISRSPEELVAAAMGPHHQYPDGVALYLGTMFVPSKDRGEKGKGFTHKSRRHRHHLVGEIRRARQSRAAFARLSALDIWREPPHERPRAANLI